MFEPVRVMLMASFLGMLFSLFLLAIIEFVCHLVNDIDQRNEERRKEKKL